MKLTEQWLLAKKAIQRMQSLALRIGKMQRREETTSTISRTNVAELLRKARLYRETGKATRRTQRRKNVIHSYAYFVVEPTRLLLM
jgi:hypothetical protein